MTFGIQPNQRHEIINEMETLYKQGRGQEWTRQCLWCGGKSVSQKKNLDETSKRVLKACSGCCIALYCSELCQKKHWRRGEDNLKPHKPKCASYKNWGTQKVMRKIDNSVSKVQKIFNMPFQATQAQRKAAKERDEIMIKKTREMLNGMSGLMGMTRSYDVESSPLVYLLSSREHELLEAVSEQFKKQAEKAVEETEKMIMGDVCTRIGRGGYLENVLPSNNLFKEWQTTYQETYDHAKKILEWAKTQI